MNQKEQEKLKETLLLEKKAIENELAGFTNKNPLIEGDYQAHFHKPDPSDTQDEKAHSIMDYEEERAIEQNLELRLREINEALDKLEKGTYGVCSKCLSPIDQKRLDVFPVASFCFNCAKKAKLI